MELKRTMLAVALSMAVFLLYSYLVPKRPVPAVQTQGGSSGAAPAVPTAPAAPGAAAPASGTAPAAASGGPALGTGAPVVRSTLENDRMTVELSSQGGAVVGARLKNYTEGLGAGAKRVELLHAESGAAGVGDVRLSGAGLGFGAPFREAQRSAGRLVYVWDSPAGVSVEKVYTLEPGRYDVGLTVRIRNGGAGQLRDRPALGVTQDYSGDAEKYAFVGPAYLKEGKLEEVKLKKLEQPVQDSGVRWVAMEEKYFLVAAVPSAQSTGNLRLERYQGLQKAVQGALEGAQVDVAPGGETSVAYRLYLGPKLADALAPLGADLGGVINYGWFHVIAKPLLHFLKALYSVTGNYGIAIIVLTTLVKGAFWPLSARSFRSMQKMKELQPKMQKLKERYAKDRERLNLEVMQLYKTHKVNPLGGCLPMLLQIPVFFALYKVLLNSIELRHAPFLLWIHDLSARDPYYVTPLIMGASMFLQQKMTPATGTDEVQMKMMLYGMPLIFTFMFLNFPSGLVLYWLVNNLLSILQQWMMIRGSRLRAAAA